MSDDRPRPIQLSEMKTQQAKEHSCVHTEPTAAGFIGENVGSIVGQVAQNLKRDRADFMRGYDASRSTGNIPPLAAVAGMIEVAKGVWNESKHQFSETVDSVSVGFKKGVISGKKSVKPTPGLDM